ncbi:RNA polymerase sporulation sigma factor SigK [Iocasia frigidifontis]|uniref:RNA polymerase sigma factor n=1 Tax=Iocasia fonsfrigidae TaxID=2682810 RepID=A0A8A7KAT4_9FIRM|nr:MULTISPECIES: RNA polymerase sporulation sigma factor SigK [Halanaerobiaceae]AZO95700.1 RNA polymerase sporulation sigma factor SigK [Halocella sp. SP3-1]MTI60894.1 RNA polymerase sporulation sigma factor SigK [Bacillota bacterium]QTL98561.1 RNA polymerase sporulation sigma factor SigK [Iocasia fonsfrigidae]
MLSLLVGLIKGYLILVSYLRSGKVFPEPLSREDEQKYLELMTKGDEKARNILIEHNLRLVAHIVKKYDSTHTDNEDLISIGTIGLIKGINTYDGTKKTKLATYAARCIENEILMHLRSTKKLSHEMLLQESIGSDREGNEITLLDILEGNEDSVINKVEKTINEEKLYYKLENLSEREKKVIQLRYGLLDGEQLTQREVAAILGISRSYVSRIEKKAIEELARLFNK